MAEELTNHSQKRNVSSVIFSILDIEKLKNPRMRSVIFIFGVLLSHLLVAQQQKAAKPTLDVGIVVDQMRQEYLYRFYDKFGEGGFKRMMNDGFMLKNAHYNYAPTVTGPGHASVYTGTTPAIHGIIGNEYYDKVTKGFVNCVEDDRFKSVGNDA